MAVTVSTLKTMKENKEKITMLTAYDYSTAKIVDEAGIDTIYINAQIFKKSAFYRELLRQVLCIPTVDSTDIFNYETFNLWWSCS